ncbi:MAG: 50S ribosomal protein L5 [Candidatus Liptonbacteria bacterium]|nr:50S ribosomal protein L5 [Candidatus Liptonbacteria bacterium]
MIKKEKKKKNTDIVDKTLNISSDMSLDVGLIKNLSSTEASLKGVKIEKIIVSVGIGKSRQLNSQFDEKILPEIKKELSLITGQIPTDTQSKKSIAGFKVREGEVVGLKITLRRKRMNDFLKRLINTVLPRVRDFKGIDLKSVDKNGGLNIGFKEQVVFPEINQEISKASFGLQVTVALNTGNRNKAIDFYKEIGVPFKK